MFFICTNYLRVAKSMKTNRFYILFSEQPLNIAQYLRFLPFIGLMSWKYRYYILVTVEVINKIRIWLGLGIFDRISEL